MKELIIHGAEYLRDVVDFINSRDEHLNDNKSCETLIEEFTEHTWPECKKRKYTMHKYRITFKHDNGRSNMIIFATSYERAILMFCAAENAPESAILIIKRFIKS